MSGSECTARFEANDQRLRRLEESATIEQVTQAAAAEVFHHPEHRGCAIEFDVAPVEHGGDVGMPECSGDLCTRAELPAEGLVLGQIRLHDLERDRLVRLNVKGRADHGVGPR